MDSKFKAGDIVKLVKYDKKLRQKIGWSGSYDKYIEKNISNIFEINRVSGMPLKIETYVYDICFNKNTKINSTTEKMVNSTYFMETELEFLNETKKYIFVKEVEKYKMEE